VLPAVSPPYIKFKVSACRTRTRPAQPSGHNRPRANAAICCTLVHSPCPIWIPPISTTMEPSLSTETRPGAALGSTLKMRGTQEIPRFRHLLELLNCLMDSARSR
jgi:hypothetical protein